MVVIGSSLIKIYKINASQKLRFRTCALCLFELKLTSKMESGCLLANSILFVVMLGSTATGSKYSS